jgi:hypothetical protein
MDNFECLDSAISSLIFGTLVFLGYGLIRGSKWPENLRLVYEKRVQIWDLPCRPPPLPKIQGISKWWTYLYPVFTLSDLELLRTASTDALFLIRFLVMGFQIFAPITVISLGLLLPIYLTGTGLEQSQEYGTSISNNMKATLSNINQGSSALWIPFFVQYFYIIWTTVVLYCHMKSFIVLKLMHLHYKAVGYLDRQEVAERSVQEIPRLLWELAWPFAMHKRDVAMLDVLVQRHAFSGPDGSTDGSSGRLDIDTPLIINDDDDITAPLLNKKGSNNISPEEEAEIPEAVCPWWLPPEQQPASVCHLQGAPSHRMLGKISPKLRSCIYLEKTAQWLPIRNYAVLFTDSGGMRFDQELSGLLRNYVKATHDGGTTATAGGGSSSSSRLLKDVAIIQPANKEEEKNSSTDDEDDDEKGKDTTATAATTTGVGSTEEDSKMAREIGGMLTNTLKSLYPTSFTDLVYVYNHTEVVKLIEEWDHGIAHLAAAKSQLYDDALGGDNDDHKKKKSTKKSGAKIKELEDAVSELETELEQIEREIVEQRKLATETPVPTAFIALFSNQSDARSAISGRVGLLPNNIALKAALAPSPDDVNWPSLWVSHKSKMIRGAIALLPLTIAILFPIGIITGGITNIPNYKCNDNDPTWDWLCSDSIGSRLLRILLCELLPVTISTFWDTYLMPIVFYVLCQYERFKPSFSGLDLRITFLFWIYNIINGFLMAVIGGTVVSQMGSALDNPGNAFNYLGTALPAASNYFINLVSVKALFVNYFRFIWPHDGTILFVFFRAFGMSRPKCERDEAVIRLAPSYRTGRHYGAFQLILLVASAYACIAPIITAAALLFFLTAWVTWRFHALYFYQPSYDSGGSLSPMTTRACIETQIVTVFFSGAVLITSKGYWQGALMLATGWLVPVIFVLLVRNNLIHLQSQLDAQMAAGATKIRVHRENYVAAPMRRGAVGWHPEWSPGVWEKYGLPKRIC